MMDDGELPVDADGNFVSGVPVDPEDPRTQDMKPAGKISPPTRAAVSILDCLNSASVKKLKKISPAIASPVSRYRHCCNEYLPALMQSLCAKCACYNLPGQGMLQQLCI